MVDQGYTVKAACKAMDVSKSTMENWVRQLLRQERRGQTPKATAMTPDQCRIQQLEKQLRRVEMEKETLKTATACNKCNVFPRIQDSAIFSCNDSRDTVSIAS